MVAASFDNRRREQRYEVELVGHVDVDGVVHAVTVSDLSPSGALIAVDARFARGQRLVLDVEAFGAIDAQVAHAAAGFCGLEFLNPAAHRDRLTDWLQARFSKPR